MLFLGSFDDHLVTIWWLSIDYLIIITILSAKILMIIIKWLSEDNLIMWWSCYNDILSYLMLILWSSDDNGKILMNIWLSCVEYLLVISWLSDDHLLIIWFYVDNMIIIWRFIIWRTSDDNIRIAYRSFVDYDMII